MRSASKGLKSIEQLPDPAVGGIHTVPGDVFPNFIDVEIGIDTEIRSHAGLPAMLGFALQPGARRGWLNGFAAVEGSKAAAQFPIEFRQPGSARRIFQKPEGFPDDLAG
jgi:hypothetical protein